MKRNTAVMRLAGAMLACFSMTALAQEYPAKTVKFVLPYAPGSTIDAVVRFVAGQFQARTGQPAVVEYKPGANALVGAQAVLNEPRDGYTLYTPAAGVATWKVFNKESSIDLKRDFVPITSLYTVGYMLVANTTVPVKTLGELISHAKANPGKINYGSSSGAFMLSMELLKRMTRMDLVQVPYKAGADAKRGLLANEVQVILDNDAFHVEQMRAGKEVILAVTSRQRIPNIPDVPTVAESGFKDYVAGSWSGVFVGSGTPAPVINRIYAVARAAVESNEYKELLAKVGFGNMPGGATPAEFAKDIEAEMRAYEELAAKLGLK